MAIKRENDDKYDMLIHKDSKFLFYNFTGYFSRINSPLQLIRRTTIADDNYALNVLQDQCWQYFIDRISKVSEKKSLKLKPLAAAVGINENKLIIDTIDKIDIFKKVYNNFYRTVIYNLTKFLAYCPMLQLDATTEDMHRNGWPYIYFKNNNNNEEIKQTFSRS